MTVAVTAASQVGETIERHPSTGPIFLQGGRLYVALLNAAADSEQFAERTASRSRPEREQGGWRERTPPMGSIGYTGSYREPSADIAVVSVVSVLEARGPE